MRRLAAMVLLGALGCDPASHVLVVDVRSDLTPGVEVDAIEVVLDERADPRAGRRRGGPPRGRPRRGLASVPAGDHVVRVRALLNGRPSSSGRSRWSSAPIARSRPS
ncbi:MAG: hypothetical protein R3B82_26665 [Sandaracinaceae bacterium]